MPFERSLYDLDYLAANCSIDYPYDPSTELDTSLSTAVTNYGITFLAFVVVLYLLRVTATRDFHWYCRVAFLLWTGLGYGTAGAFHHVAEDVMATGNVVWFFSSLAMVHLSLPCLEVTLTDSPVWRLFLAVINLAATLVVVVLQQKVFSALWLFGSFFILSVVYGWRKQDYARAIGCAWNWMGLVILVVFAGTCGSAAQKDCFKDCIFPTPTTFNHNGVFHLFVAVGVIMFGLAELMEEVGSKTAPLRLEAKEIEKEEDPQVFDV